MIYVLHPGLVRSKNDKDQHYVDGNRLAALYGLKPGEYRFAKDGYTYPDAINLYPRRDGNYHLPKDLSCTR